MLDAMFFTDAVKQVFESPFIFEAIGELDAIICEDGMDAIRHGVTQLA